MPHTIFDRVVDLCNNVIETSDSDKKANNINQIKELIVYKDPSLLDNFYEDVLGLLIERNANVRITVIDFIECACKCDPDLVNKSVERLRFLVDDESFSVLKKLAASMMTIYPLSLLQAIKSKGTITDNIESFQYCIFIVESLIKKVDSPNGGMLLMLIKLMETIIILQSQRYPDSDVPKGKENDLSLDKIPKDLAVPCLQINKLENFGLILFDIIIKLLNRDHSSSAHIHTLLASLTNIGRQRPQFMSRVIESFELTHVNMPDKLGEIQVNSIRKALKGSLCSLLKHPSSQEYQNQVSTLLIDLGMTQSEISRLLPKTDETTLIKRKLKESNNSTSGKRPRTSTTHLDPSDLTYNDSIIKKFAPSSSEQKSPSSRRPNYVEQLSKELIPKLNTVINVTDLVLLSMMMLPDTMPPAFQSAYTPIAAAGTQTQISHLSRLLSAQLVSAGYLSLESKEKREVTYQTQNDKLILDELNMAGYVNPKSQMILLKKHPFNTLKPFNLEAVTKSLPTDLMQEIIRHSYERILVMPLLNNVLKRCRANSNNSLAVYTVDSGNMPKWYYGRHKILTSLPSALFGGAELYSVLIKYCMKDIKNRFDILSSLLMQEFINYKAFQLAPVKHRENVATPRLATKADYDAVLTGVLKELITSDVKETYFGRMLLEAPLITTGALNILRSYCSAKVNADYGFQILRELFNNRPGQRKELLMTILEFSSEDCVEVRTAALSAAKWILMVSLQCSEDVLEFAKSNLNHLLLPKPSNSIYPLKHLTNIPLEWTDEVVRPCLYLFLALMPVNHSLIHLLAEVFVKSCQVVKRTIIKMIDIPIKEMGMCSEEILRLVENCDSNQVVLIIRVIHILTDKALPSLLLVEKLKYIYHNKFSDVRLIIPILKGLTKSEMIEILPKLVVLNEKLVSEVFRRLLDVSAFDPVKGDFIVKTSPILPEELLIAVHQLEFVNVELKVVIEASKMCFREKQIFTQERLSIVIGQLLDLPVLPTLFMRTLMQSFSMYPRMVGYVVNVLSRLIKKQVWKNSSLWDGFIRCCGKLGQQSFAVLLQLPVDKLESVFNSVPEFRNQMRRYIDNCTQSQKLHISSAILNLINSNPTINQILVEPVNNIQINVSSANVSNEVPAVSTEVVVNESNTIFITPKTEKFTSSSLAKAAMDKEKLDEERKKKEKAKQLLEKGGNKISFFPTKSLDVNKESK